MFRRNAAPGVVTIVGSVVTVVLMAGRPRLDGPVTAWNGDELALACTWGLSLFCSAWLAVTTLMGLGAAARGHVKLAHRIARLAPPVARRALETALVGTWAIVPAPAYAAAARSTPDVPVVRTPTSTTGPAARPTPETPETPETPSRPRTYAVRAGDNLWRIATAEIARAGRRADPDPTAREVARYWRRLIEANRTTLRSGDPSLIFPGELVTLPELDARPR